MNSPSWVYVQGSLGLTIVAAWMGWLIGCQLIGRARARAGDYAGAQRWYRRTLDRQIQLGGLLTIAANRLYAGDAVAAERDCRGVFADARRSGHRRLERMSLINLSASLIAQGRTAEAGPILEWVLRGRASANSGRERGAALFNLAWIAFLDRDFEEAGRKTAAARGEARRPTARLEALLALMEARRASRAGRFSEGREALAVAERRAAADPDRALVDEIHLARAILEYLAGRHERGLEEVLAAAGAPRDGEHRGLAARWLTGLAWIARERSDEAAAARLERLAAELRGRLPIPPPQDCAAYLRA